jgi:hypothetical protein
MLRGAVRTQMRIGLPVIRAKNRLIFEKNSEMIARNARNLWNHATSELLRKFDNGEKQEASVGMLRISRIGIRGIE